MGTCCSSLNETVHCIYDKNYPKQKWLSPIYLTSAGMVGSIACASMATVATKTNSCRNFWFLAGIGSSIGLHLWVTCIEDATVSHLLPRHQFGLTHRHLFPKYLFLTTAFSFGSLLAFLKSNPFNSWTDDNCKLGWLLGGAFILNIVNFTCFGVNTIKYNEKMHQIEQNAGVGQNTVGKIIQDSKLENDKDYIQTKSKYFRFHCLSCTANLVTFAATVGQLYLVSKAVSF